MKKEDLLKVLDMSEDEQLVWTLKIGHGDRHFNESFADLAFRLRDEAVNETNNFIQGRLDVYQRHIQNQGINQGLMVSDAIDDVDVWFVSCAKPIHWIIAALIAKGE